ncbi:MAG: hypothetical protein COX57_05665 [Alphaproteobacteria bacterium CG_4_10_14_0_2_um_filter_63_37]|nr:MAG: hypothetical protein COX57_05665 [Alphaproteobacteria bacterium CG_4_10_14_0_2_um_filter_63_37]
MSARDDDSEDHDFLEVYKNSSFFPLPARVGDVDDCTFLMTPKIYPPEMIVCPRCGFDLDSKPTVRTLANDPPSGNSGVGKWCSPGPAEAQTRNWMMVFDDAVRPAVYLGDDEIKARAAFARAEANGWNCHLYQTAPRVERK